MKIIYLFIITILMLPLVFADLPIPQSARFYSLNGNSKLDGAPIPVGAIVTAYIPNGFECGAALVTTEGLLILDCVADNPNTPTEVDGGIFGDEISFAINDISATVIGGSNIWMVGAIEVNIEASSGVCTNGETRNCTKQDGVCAGTTETCTGGDWPGCDYTSLPDYSTTDDCDDLDNDCDASTDEDYVETGTSCGVGACADTGLMQCISGSEVNSCSAGTPAADDATCDGVDDDCNGAVDEDYVSSGTNCGIGACADTGLLECIAGSEVDSCSAGTPAADDDTCDGVDDDCDASTDEDYVETGTSCGTGACADTGLMQCISGSEVDSCLPGTPAADDATCDGVDDDCNGAVDEDYVFDESCFLPGACAADNVGSSCTGGVETSCSTGTPTAELCDGVDNDCNAGTADGSDESWLNNPCDGQDSDFCEEGISICGSGSEVCTDTTGDDIEICNAADDDCDGQIDEDFDDDGCDYICTFNGYVWSNNGGSLNCCGDDSLEDNPYQASETSCSDGQDNDCDGDIDSSDSDCFACTSGETRACAKQDGVCSGSVETCTGSGQWLGCDYTQLPDYEATEVSCDDLDNDCDGAVDGQTQPTTCGVGECSGNTGEKTCTAGSWGGDTCDAYAGATAEVCDDLDNDCDAGTADGADELTLNDPCDGADSDLCDEGSILCSAGSLTCSDSTGDNLELCNGADDDCDGATDDGADESWLGNACDGADSDLCDEGIYSCVTGSQSCSDTSGDNLEVCNGADDNCDGQIDEDFEDDECDYICMFNGHVWSNNGGSLNCCGDDSLEDNPYQASETSCSDGHDNDCDGDIDSSDSDCFACTPGETRACAKQDGVCTGTEETCSGSGQWLGCDYTQLPDYEATEVSCDDLDNDCDSSTDEDLTQACGSGACAGTRTCTTGTYGDCSTDGKDAGTCAECDADGNPVYDAAQDEDCDDTICPSDGCGVGGCDTNIFGDYPSSVENVCNGLDSCTSNSCTAACEADNDGDDYSVSCGDCDDSDTDRNPGESELCNNIDDDCDLQKDEDFTNEQCNFICETNGYIWTGYGDPRNCCGNNAFEDDPYEATETICDDGHDNDCDGLIDENDPDCFDCDPGETRLCPKQDGVCKGSGQVCETNGKWSICDYSSISDYEGSEVSCDNLDNDCDDLVDEGLTQACGSGDCVGTQTCTVGSWSDCSTAGNDAGICAECDSDGTPAYDNTQDEDCACPEDECIVADGDGLIDDLNDYPEGGCLGIDSCKSCDSTLEKHDISCKTVMKIPIDDKMSMFSIPLVPDAPVTWDDIQNGCAFQTGIDNGIAYWDPLKGDTNKYVYLYADDRLYPAQGYWTIQDHDCEFTIEGYKFTMDYVGYLETGNIYKGYNMIAAPSDGIDNLNLAKGNCNIVGPWGWNSETSGYYGTWKLEPGEAVYIWSHNDCNLG